MSPPPPHTLNVMSTKNCVTKMSGKNQLSIFTVLKLLIIKMKYTAIKYWISDMKIRNF